ncbi:uncharacterized protein L201_007341 [Kwoniella dendrophila CBS 6074]|uniref:Chromatin structure-remodeling complex subunit RSC1/2 n=1 Tax=Kwoniella dendrophila CBS 6074 TaxID=1295534 RepID=A0AAX4K4R8_9TREE
MPPRKASGSRQKAVANALPIPTSYPGLVDAKGMEEAQWQGCKELLENVYKAKDGNRKMSDIFRELPDKDDYEDYYQAIPEPECLDNISTQLGNQTYANPEAFFKQLHLVFLNAKHYNEEESLLWADAKRLEDQIHNDWKSRAEAHIFSNTDPYHSSPIKPSRKKRGNSSIPSKSATPLPEPKSSSIVEAKPATPAAELPTIPETTMVAPSPTPIPRPAPSPRTTVTIPNPVIRNHPQPTITPASPTPSDLGRSAQAEKDRSIVAALDRRLPKWSGPQYVLPGPPSIAGIQGSGWFGEGAPDYDRSTGGPAMWPHRIRAVIDAIVGYRDQNGQRFAEVLELLPATADIHYLSFHSPISLVAIQGIANASRYDTLRSFDMDMTKLFEKARRYYHEGSSEYGKVLVLQRLYNALTAVYPMPLPGSGIPAPSSTLFASLPAGPGNARSMHETAQDLKAGASEDQVGFGITTFRVGTKDRQFTEEARHKGQSFRMGDYVHLINPDDATRPIIGQIFKSFVPTKGYRTHHVTVCWYFRPEQTVHTPEKMFYEREVFKTGHFCDHPVEDILEKISVQFYVKYIRGRPRPGEYYPGWPSYVCHSRFNDREHLMVRIKNWNSCIPDSPFLRGVQGPGFFGEPKKLLAGDMEDDDDEDKYVEKEKPRRKERNKRDVQPTSAVNTPAKYSPIPTYTPAPAPIPTPTHVPASLPTPVPGPSRPVHAPIATPTPQLQSQPQPQTTHRPPPLASQPSLAGPPYLFPNRTVSAVMGGAQVMDQTAVREQLSQDTARLFERDARGHVLWFSGPPLAPGTIPIPTQQPHSLEYLTYITKRKKGENASPQKRARRSKEEEVEPKSDAETLQNGKDDYWWAEGQTPEQIAASIKSLIESL